MNLQTKLNNSIRVVTGLVGLALLAYALVFFTREGTKLASWSHSGGARSEIRWDASKTPGHPDSLLTFRQVATEDFGTLPYPVAGDTILRLGDSLATYSAWRWYFDSPRQVGERIPVLAMRQGDSVAYAIRLSEPGAVKLAGIFAIQALRFLLTVAFLGVGLWAFFAQPDSAAVRVLAWFCFGMAAFTMAAVATIFDRHAAFSIPYQKYFEDVLIVIFGGVGGFWLNLQLLFPRPVRLMQRHPWLSYSLCYVPFAAVVIQQVIVPDGNEPEWIDAATMSALVAQLLAGIALLAYRYARATDRLEKRQARLVLLGSGMSLALFMIVMAMVGVFNDWFAGAQWRALILINILFLSLLPSPISFAYAFGRYRLLEVEGRLRRGTRYLLAFVTLILIVAGIGYAFASFLRSRMEGGSTIFIAVMLVLAAALVPGIRAIQRLLERWFYPERLRLRQMIRDFLQHALSIPDKATFWTELQRRLREGLGVDRVHPVLLAASAGHYTCMVAGETPFTTDSEFVERLTRERRPVLVDEALASSRVHLTREEAGWLEYQRVGLVLPLVSHSSLIGFLGLGQKTENEDYAAEELRILDSLSSQIALASENIRLLEDNIVKKQLEEQLQMARRIQQGFLPQEIPAVKGLDIAAGSRFCLDVAGDYYDVVPLENGQTVLAVGDVSGKGAGAALLMANLQASLRTAVGMGSSLDNVVARVNDLICRNTPPDQYITFFVALYDPEESTVTYVNAGHNPPMLVHANGETRLLSTGGLILGFLPSATYEQETFKLYPGDLLIMYTDGVSEAMDGAEREFGEDRICETICARRSEPIEKVLSVLEDEVIRHHGSDCFDDDFTLLLVRAQ